MKSYLNNPGPTTVIPEISWDEHDERADREGDAMRRSFRPARRKRACESQRKQTRTNAKIGGAK